MAIDFVKFAVDAIKIIDELRSTGADPKDTDHGSAKPIESRINTFYRAIGLPAFSTDKTIEDKELNSGNLHEKFADPENSEVKGFIKDTKLRESNFSLELTEEAQIAFLDNMEETVLGSIKRLNEDGGRGKGGLFPMVVNGNIRIIPQDRRVSGAFFQKDSQLGVSNARYRRPLIEAIVLLRLRTQGFINATDVEKLNSDFEDSLPVGFFDGAGENILTLEITKSLANAITDPDGIIKIIDLTIEKLGVVRSQVRASFKDSKEATVAEQQPRTGSSDGEGKFEKQNERREKLKAENDARSSLLGYDDTISSEVTKNMKDALFMPMVLDAMLTNTNEINKMLEEDKAKEKKLDQQNKRLNKNMDLILGSYSGISGIDVLIVITALFSIQIEDLLGLLNKKSIERLKKIKGEQELPVQIEITKAIKNLENKTIEIFNILDSKVEVISLREENTNEV